MDCGGMGKPTNSKSETAVGVSGMEVAPGARTPCPPSPWKPGSGPSGLPVATPQTSMFSNRPTCRNAVGFRLVLAPCWCIAGVRRGAAWGTGAVYPGDSCSLPGSRFPLRLESWPRSSDASASWFRGSYPVTEAGRHTFVSPCLQAAWKTLGTKNGKKEAGSAGFLAPLSLRSLPCPWTCPGRPLTT